jgi:hypothetical protein
MLIDGVCPKTAYSEDSSKNKRKSGRWFEAIRRFAFLLSFFRWNIWFTAIFLTPEPVANIALMAAVPPLFVSVVQKSFSAAGAFDFITTSAWTRKGLSVCVPPFVPALIGAKDALPSVSIATQKYSALLAP